MLGFSRFGSTSPEMKTTSALSLCCFRSLSETVAATDSVEYPQSSNWSIRYCSSLLTLTTELPVFESFLNVFDPETNRSTGPDAWL